MFQWCCSLHMPSLSSLVVQLARDLHGDLYPHFTSLFPHLVALSNVHDPHVIQVWVTSVCIKRVLIHMHTCTCACTHTCTHMYHECTHTHMDTHVHMHVHTHMDTCMYTHKHKRAHSNHVTGTEMTHTCTCSVSSTLSSTSSSFYGDTWWWT